MWDVSCTIGSEGGFYLSYLRVELGKIISQAIEQVNQRGIATIGHIEHQIQRGILWQIHIIGCGP